MNNLKPQRSSLIERETKVIEYFRSNEFLTLQIKAEEEAKRAVENCDLTRSLMAFKNPLRKQGI